MPFEVASRRPCNTLALIVAGGLGISSKAQNSSAKPTEMLNCSGPCVDVTLDGGKHLRMVVDTGNDDLS
jgi:hypothetical protein